MDTKHEALELADFLERDHRNWHSRAPQVLRRQHARIEELERALQQMPNLVRDGIADYVAQWSPISVGSSDVMCRFIKTIEIDPQPLIASALLTKKD
jgi:hypothetical protein